MTSGELIYGVREQAPVSGEPLRCVVSPGIDDGHPVVRAQVALDELACRLLDVLRAKRIDVQVIQDHDVDPPVERPLVRLHIGLGQCSEWDVGFEIERDIDRRKRRDRLPHTVLENLEIVLREIGDDVTLRVGHDGIDFDVTDAGFEQ